MNLLDLQYFGGKYKTLLDFKYEFTGDDVDDFTHEFVITNKLGDQNIKEYVELHSHELEDLIIGAEAFVERLKELKG